MSRKILFEQFEQISEAPDGAVRFKQLVIDLAVAGRFNTNSRNETVPASYLSAPQCQDYSSSWRVLAFGKYFDIQGGNQPPKSQFVDEPRPGYVRLFQIRDLGDNPVPTFIPIGATNRFCSAGDILIGRYGASVGKIFWAQEGAYNVALAKLIFPSDAFDRRYIFWVLKSDKFQFPLAGASRSAQAGFNKRDLSGIEIPLPPLAEQHRIVAKVGELMALCDELEAAQAKREARRDRLVAATLHRLNNGDAAQDGESPSFRETARFYFNHLPRLTTRPEHIRQLRQTILNLAVRGKLVPQDPNDEPASVVLAKIQIEKRRDSTSGPSRSNAELSAQDGNGELFHIPKNWAWTRLQQLAHSFRYGTSRKCSYDRKGSPVLRIPNVSGGRISTEDLKFTTLSDKEVNHLALRDGDILMIRSNGSLNLVGRPALVTSEAAGYFYAGYLVRIRFVPGTVNSELMVALLNSRFVRDQIELPIRSAVGLKNVNSREIGNLRFPVPPLAEQHRIVAKVDELMALCDELESRLTETATTRRRLLEATLQEALASA